MHWSRKAKMVLKERDRKGSEDILSIGCAKDGSVPIVKDHSKISSWP